MFTSSETPRSTQVTGITNPESFVPKPVQTVAGAWRVSIRMNRFGALGILAAVACGPAAPVPAHVERQVGSAGSAVAPVASPAAPIVSGPVVTRSQAGTRARIEAPHGGAITTLAITADGASAITCDELGGLRLWPTLDGKTEPRIVELPRPRELALGADPRGFIVAMTDDVGGLVLQVVDADGLTLQRASLAGDPAYAGVAMTTRGTIAWRADQVLVRLRTDGTIGSQLPAEAGQRILDVAVAGDRAVAVIETGTSQSVPTQRARWITLGDQLAWGAWVDAGTEVGRVISASPSGKRLASLGNAGTTPRVIVVDTGTGKVIANEMAPGAVAIGLADDDHVAVATQTGISWIALDTAKPTQQPATVGGAAVVVEQGILGIGGGHAVAASNGELMIATPTKLEFLGYELASPAVAAAAPKGQLLIGVGDTFALLDKDLRAISAPTIGIGAGSAVSSLLWLAGDDWLVETSKIADGLTTLSLVDIAHQRTQVIRSGMAIVQTPMFEPTTNLVTLSLGDLPGVSTYDRDAHRLSKLAVMPKPKSYEQVELVPVVPAIAAGVQVVVAQMRDRMTLRWLKDPRALDRGVSITVDGSLAGVDRAGHVFVWQTTPAGPLELAVYADGKRTGKLASDGPAMMYPDLAGTRILQVGQRSVTLVALDGAVAWTQTLEGVTEALWLDDGSIGIVSAAGLARLDAATGKVLAARCGWRFGLAARQHPVSPRVEPVCAQVR